jgi:preprotein translocase subunit SecA
MIAEMYTGEGKTLAATLPAYLNALTGHGVHVVTVNDYLAQRDAVEMSAVYGFLGLSVGVLQNGLQQSHVTPGSGQAAACTRKEAYEADITYGTASEFAFDYLRDNRLNDPKERVQRTPWAVILDEIDSLLIDEARVPHIIAGKAGPPEVEQLFRARDAVAKLDWKTDVEWDADENWAMPTEQGFKKLEELLGIDNLQSLRNSNLLAYVMNAVKALYIMRRGANYTVKNGEVRAVGLSGHAYPGRRYSEGLHQALEAKEDLLIRPDDATLAMITMRDYLSGYLKRGGMTGTAMSASNVFRNVYGLEVARVRPRLKLIRVDHPDRHFRTEAEKRERFIADVIAAHSTGRPIQVACELTSTADELTAELRKHGIDPGLLTAKNDKDEAEVVANAGRLGAVTVTTAIGGRGVDIKLGGDKRSLARRLMTEDPSLILCEAEAKAAKMCAEECASVLAKGGLLVMAYEHFDSRRRDDQLRGRAGRQGDPGATVFYSSLEDKLFDGFDSAEELKEHPDRFSPALAADLTERALDRSEGRVNDFLERSVSFDNTNARAREHFYEMRQEVLEAEDPRALTEYIIESAIDRPFVAIHKALPLNEIDANSLWEELGFLLPLPESGPPKAWVGEMTGDQIRAQVDEIVRKLLADRDTRDPLVARVNERANLILAMDEAWSHHLDASLDLELGIGFRGYAQKDPRVEYMREAAQLFEGMREEFERSLTAATLKNVPL